MVFSSNVFLFVFLPCVLLGYYLLKRWRTASNAFLTLASLGFYAWGEPTFVFVMMASIVCNWLFGLWVDREKDRPRRQKLVLTLMVILNLGLLCVFKYLMFFLNSINWAFHLNLPVPEIALPIGISFFTFQSMSYVIDVKRGHGKVQKNLMNVALYISFFPQLIAGPIVRYETVAEEITNRRENVSDFIYGARRFLIGLCKKVILANNIGIMLNMAISLPADEITVASAWIGAFCFMLQVYFDFSGYSDMAIGLGRMFGFHFLENFNFPFISKSVAEFWRRWHMSLTTWFRDYVYFPLGGSRVKSKFRLGFNLFVVWFFTGLWHGADATYVLWGLLCFAAQAIERFTGLGKWMEKHWVGHVYAVVVIVAMTVLVPCVDMANAGVVYRAMFGIECAGLWNGITTVLVKEYGLFFLAGCICSMPVHKFLGEKLHIPEGLMRVVGAVGLVALTILSISYVATDSYNPFIYFNF